MTAIRSDSSGHVSNWATGCLIRGLSGQRRISPGGMVPWRTVRFKGPTTTFVSPLSANGIFKHLLLSAGQGAVGPLARHSRSSHQEPVQPRQAGEDSLGVLSQSSRRAVDRLHRAVVESLDTIAPLNTVPNFIYKPLGSNPVDVGVPAALKSLQRSMPRQVERRHQADVISRAGVEVDEEVRPAHLPKSDTIRKRVPGLCDKYRGSGISIRPGLLALLAHGFVAEATSVASSLLLGHYSDSLPPSRGGIQRDDVVAVPRALEAQLVGASIDLVADGRPDLCKLCTQGLFICPALVEARAHQRLPLHELCHDVSLRLLHLVRDPVGPLGKSPGFAIGQKVPHLLNCGVTHLPKLLRGHRGQSLLAPGIEELHRLGEEILLMAVKQLGQVHLDRVATGSENRCEVCSQAAPKGL